MRDDPSDAIAEDGPAGQGVPFYTIIVVCFNAGEKLHGTLESILGQTFADYEILVKDGGSTDGSLDTVPSDSRIRLIRERDGGIYDAMNTAVRKARGQYCYFLNCGDRLHDSAVLGEVHARIAGKVPAIYYGDVVEMKTGQTVAANPKMSHFAMFRYLPCHQACFYSADLFGKRQFDLRYRVRADYEHFLWSVMQAGAAAVAMPLTVADYEGGGFSETPEGRENSRREHQEICRRYFTRRERFLFRLYLAVSLQPLRERLAGNPRTAALYDGIKNRLYGRHRAEK